MIPHELKEKICEDINENGLHIQEASNKYGISLERIEAILKLSTIEKEWSANSGESVCIN